MKGRSRPWMSASASAGSAARPRRARLREAARDACGSTMPNSSNWRCSPASAACRTRGCATSSTRGARIRAILDQPQHAPLRLADEVALVLAVQSGLLDPLPLPAVVDVPAGPARCARPRRPGCRPPDPGDRHARRRAQTDAPRDAPTAMFRPSLRRARRQGGRSHDRTPRRHQRADRRASASSARWSTQCAASPRRAPSRPAASSPQSTAMRRRSRPPSGRPSRCSLRSCRRRAPIDAAGAGAVLRRAGICRRLQRTRARRGRRRSRHRPSCS